TGAGLFDSWSFDPIAWKPNYPNPAFLMMDSEDAFWAAKQVAAFTDDEITAIVKTGEYSDQRAADWIAECLIKRRAKIAQAWFSRVLPLDKFRIADGELVFADLSAGRALTAARNYNVSWSRYENDYRRLTTISNATGTKLPPVSRGTDYLAATIARSSAAGSACPDPITVYLRRAGTGFEVVGVDR